MNNYIAFYADQGEYKAFETFDEAEKWLQKFYIGDEGYTAETMTGEDYIAKITHRSKYVETDNKSNYPEYDELSDDDPWPYLDWDSVGDIILKEVEEESKL